MFGDRVNFMSIWFTREVHETLQVWKTNDIVCVCVGPGTFRLHADHETSRAQVVRSWCRLRTPLGAAGFSRASRNTAS